MLTRIQTQHQKRADSTRPAPAATRTKSPRVCDLLYIVVVCLSVAFVRGRVDAMRIENVTAVKVNLSLYMRAYATSKPQTYFHSTPPGTG